MEIIYPKLDLENFKRVFRIREKRPNQVQIEITNNCNLRCRMCPTDDFALPRANMRLELFKEILTKLPYVKFVVPNGWGEPFIHPNFDKIVDLLKDNGHKIKLTTNGTLLNNERMVQTAMKIDYLAFSVDEINRKKTENGHFWDNQVKTNIIKKIIEKRNSEGLKNPYITIQQVLYKGNNDTAKIIKFAADLKVDRINIIRPFIKYNISLAQPWPERLKVYRSAEKLGRRLNIRIDMFEYAFFNGYKRFLWMHFKRLFGFNNWCPRLYDFVYITMDGHVTPCCELPRYIVGDLLTQTLEEIWNGKKMETYRKKHKEICKDCHIYKIR